MSNYNTILQSNNTDLQTILSTINALPDAGGVELPELSNPATAAEVFANKELIDADGNKIVGTFTIENELTAQDDLISQIQAAVDSLPDAGGGGSGTNDGSVETYNLIIESDGETKALMLMYITYNNGKYEYHDDSFSSFTFNDYPITLTNVVLKTPIYIISDGGISPCCKLVSNLVSDVDVVHPYDYVANVNQHFEMSGYFLPLHSDNGQIVIRCYDDD